MENMFELLNTKPKVQDPPNGAQLRVRSEGTGEWERGGKGERGDQQQAQSPGPTKWGAPQGEGKRDGRRGAEAGGGGEKEETGEGGLHQV